jgi:AcrR family transcriptional regulator
MTKPVTRLVPKPPRIKHARGKGRRAEYSASTKRALVDVAEELFTEHGYAGTSLDAIVAGARVTKGALYHHFAGKQALFEAVFERVEQAASSAIHERIKGEQDPWEKARAGLRTFLEEVRAPTYRRIVIQDGPAVLGYERYREQEERSTFANVLAIVASVLTDGMGSGQRGMDPMMGPGTGPGTGRVMDEAMQRTFARIFFGAMASAGESVSLAEDPDAASERVEAAISIILAGLQALAGSATPAPGTATSSPR